MSNGLVLADEFDAEARVLRLVFAWSYSDVGQPEFLPTGVE